MEYPFGNNKAHTIFSIQDTLLKIMESNEAIGDMECNVEIKSELVSYCDADDYSDYLDVCADYEIDLIDKLFNLCMQKL